jgi:heptosyltransferase-2
MKNIKIKNILVIMMGGIGNLILAMPALKSLRQAYPKAHIILMTGEPNIEDVIINDDLVNEVVCYDRRQYQGVFSELSFILQMRKKKFDLSFSTSGTNSFLGSFATFLMGIPRRIGENIRGLGVFYTTKISYDKCKHELDGSLEIIEAFGVPIIQKDTFLTVAVKEQNWAEQFLKETNVGPNDMAIGIHPGSGHKQIFKRWPKKKYAELCSQLISRLNARIIIFGGEQEKELAEEINKTLKYEAINVSGELTIGQTSALISKCNLLISNDSGLAHIGGALKTPEVVLFGKTNIDRIAQRGRDVMIINKKEELKENGNPLDLITVEEVLDKVLDYLQKKKEVI